MTFHIGRRALWSIRTICALLAIAIVATFPLRAIVLISGLSLCVIWICVPYACRSFHATVTATAVYLQYGVLWKHETVVALSAIRSIDRWTPPLCCFSDTCMVVLHFAGGSVYLPFLSLQSAITLVGLLQQKEI